VGLLDEVAAERKSKGSACAVAQIRAALTADDAADLDLVLDNPAVQGASIARALTNRGHRIGQQSIQRHRRKDCNCG